MAKRCSKPLLGKTREAAGRRCELVPESSRQVPLFDPADSPWDDISRSMDELRNKYGKPVVLLGSCLNLLRGKNET